MAKYRFSKPKPARVAPGWCHNSKEEDEHKVVAWLMPEEGLVCAVCGGKVELKR